MRRKNESCLQRNGTQRLPRPHPQADRAVNHAAIASASAGAGLDDLPGVNERLECFVQSRARCVNLFDELTGAQRAMHANQLGCSFIQIRRIKTLRQRNSENPSRTGAGSFARELA